MSHVPQIHETTEQRDARMQWFRDAKFGMFIHWGPCSVGSQEIGWDRHSGDGVRLRLVGELHLAGLALGSHVRGDQPAVDPGGHPAGAIEHCQAKWVPVRRSTMR